MTAGDPLATFLDEAVREGVLVTLAFDDREVVTLADPEGGGDILVLFGSDRIAEASASEAWAETAALTLDADWAGAWLDGFPRDFRFGLVLDVEDLTVVDAGTLSQALRAARDGRGVLPSRESRTSAPNAMDASEVSRLHGLDVREQYELFVTEIALNGHAWGLLDESGWVSFSADGRELRPFWPHPAIAESCATGHWNGARPAEVSGQSYLAYLGHLQGTGGATAVMVTPDHGWIEMPPDQLAADILNRRAQR